MSQLFTMTMVVIIYVPPFRPFTTKISSKFLFPILFDVLNRYVFLLVF